MRRRQFIALFGGAAASLPLPAPAQPMAVVAHVGLGTAESSAQNVAAFRKGLSEAGIIEGQNVTIEYHWLAGQYDRQPALMADLVRRRVAAIVTPGATPAALAAK